MKAISIIAISMLAACYSQDKFTSDYIEATCNKMDECAPDAMTAAGYADAGECIDALNSAADGSDSSSDCSFDKGAAQDCVDGLNALSCDDYADPTKWPDCSKVCG